MQCRAAAEMAETPPGTSASGQNAKYSERADNFRFAPMNGHHQARMPCRKGATIGHGRSESDVTGFVEQNIFDA